jgi:hypothetical protein
VLADPLAHARRLAERLRHELRSFPELIIRYALAPARTSFRDSADPRLGVDVWPPSSPQSLNSAIQAEREVGARG